MMYRTTKPACVQPISLETRLLLHERNPLASYLKFVRNLWTPVIVHYRVDFRVRFLEMESVEKPFPPRNQPVEIYVGNGGWCRTNVLHGDSEEPRLPRWRWHFNHIGVSFHSQLRTTGGDFGVNVPDQAGYACACANPSGDFCCRHVKGSLPPGPMLKSA